MRSIAATARLIWSGSVSTNTPPYDFHTIIRRIAYSYTITIGAFGFLLLYEFIDGVLDVFCGGIIGYSAKWQPRVVANHLLYELKNLHRFEIRCKVTKNFWKNKKKGRKMHFFCTFLRFTIGQINFRCYICSVIDKNTKL